MPSDSIAGFLDQAQASRVLFPEQVEQLIRQPDIPQSDLAALCAYLLDRGVLTRFQAEAIRAGRGHDLSFGGYPVIDVLGPCPGGTAYRALHPSLRTPLVLRRFAPGAFAPTDTVDAVVHRARSFGTIAHPNLHPLVDAGMANGEGYAVLDPLSNGADLGTLLKEVGGASPAFLAAEYGWAVASALRAVHERGGWHGAVRPGLLVVTPVLSKTRDDGTTRRRPERVDGTAYDARGDIYGLGACLYLLLAGRPPFAGATTEELVRKVRAAEPTALAALRPADPPELTALVMRMLAKRPTDRPQTAAEVCQALAPFCRPGTLPIPPVSAIPEAVPVASVPHAVPVASGDEPAPEPDGWGVGANALADAQTASAADRSQRRRRQLTTADKARSRLLIVLGLCLHLTAVGLIIAYLTGAFSSPPEPAHTAPDKEKKPDTPPKPKRGKKANPERDPG
jgi:hypothetical protein